MAAGSAAPTKEFPDAAIAAVGFGPPALPATALDAAAGPHAFAGGYCVTVTVTFAKLEEEFVAIATALPPLTDAARTPAICAEFAPLDNFFFPSGAPDNPTDADVPLALLLSDATGGPATSSVRAWTLAEFCAGLEVSAIWAKLCAETPEDTEPSTTTTLVAWAEGLTPWVEPSCVLPDEETFPSMALEFDSEPD